MKRLLSLALVSLLFLAVSAARAAGIGETSTIVLNATNSLARNSTNTAINPSIIGIQGKEVAFQFTFAQTSATNNTQTLTFAKSVDGVTFGTDAPISFSLSSTGTNAVTIVTNFTINGVRALQLQAVGNTNTAADCTNWVLKISNK